jgi:hypothetical protein
VEHGYLGIIDVDTSDMVASLSEAPSRNETYIACAEYRNAHFKFLLAVGWRA